MTTGCRKHFLEVIAECTQREENISKVKADTLMRRAVTVCEVRRQEKDQETLQWYKNLSDRTKTHVLVETQKLIDQEVKSREV